MSGEEIRAMDNLLALGYAFEFSKIIDSHVKKNCYGCILYLDDCTHHNLCQLASPREKVMTVFRDVMNDICHDQAYLNFKLLLFSSDEVKNKFIPKHYSTFIFRQTIGDIDQFKELIIKHVIDVIDF